VVCRLAEKAWREGHAVFVRCNAEAQADSLDALLWTYRDASFVPHARCDTGDADDAPVIIGTASQMPGTTGVLINLGEDVPTYFSRFERVMETTGINDSERSAARERYRFYQERGYALNTHKIDSRRG
jgi:DNA polymerase-3 subunit chi